MSIKNYPKEESLERIYRSLRGDTLNQEEGSLTGSQYSSDEALSRIAQLMQGQIPGESGALPSGISADGLGLGNYGLVVDGIGTKENHYATLGEAAQNVAAWETIFVTSDTAETITQTINVPRGVRFFGTKKYYSIVMPAGMIFSCEKYFSAQNLFIGQNSTNDVFQVENKDHSWFTDCFFYKYQSGAIIGENSLAPVGSTGKIWITNCQFEGNGDIINSTDETLIGGYKYYLNNADVDVGGNTIVLNSNNTKFYAKSCRLPDIDIIKIPAETKMIGNNIIGTLTSTPAWSPTQYEVANNVFDIAPVNVTLHPSGQNISP